MWDLLPLEVLPPVVWVSFESGRLLFREEPFVVFAGTNLNAPMSYHSIIVISAAMSNDVICGVIIVF